MSTEPVIQDLGLICAVSDTVTLDSLGGDIQRLLSARRKDGRPLPGALVLPSAIYSALVEQAPDCRFVTETATCRFESPHFQFDKWTVRLLPAVNISQGAEEFTYEV